MSESNVGDREEGVVKRRYRQLLEHGVSMKAALSEGVGTAGVVLLGSLVACYVTYFPAKQAGTEASVPIDPMLGNMLIALAFGLAYVIMIYTVGHNSGGHLNPAVSIGLLAAGVTPLWQACAHIVAQALGGLLGAILLRLLIPGRVLHTLHYAANTVPKHTSVAHAFSGELIGTFIVVLVILECAAHPRSRTGNNTGLVVGLAFFVAMFAFAPVSSASLNPARSLGAALVSGHLKHLWIYIIAPCLGGLLAVPLHLVSLSDLDTKLSETAGAAGLPEGAREALLPSPSPRQGRNDG